MPMNVNVPMNVDVRHVSQETQIYQSEPEDIILSPPSGYHAE